MSIAVGQWDVVKVRINPDRDIDSHPAVVVSADEICADQRQLRVNVLFGTKKLPASAKRPHAVLLNGADGLDFITEIDCGFVHVVSKKRSRLQSEEQRRSVSERSCAKSANAGDSDCKRFHAA